MRIGVFDSGIGGLTVLRALRAALPGHHYTYLGDTARIPYGTRSPLTVQRYAMAVASYLHREGVDALVVACNTATAHALPQLQAAGAQAGIPVFGVIEPGVQAALAAPGDGPIAVLGTEGTIRGGAYQAALLRHAPDRQVQAVACPLFVPLVEEGWTSGGVPEAVAQTYVGHLRGRASVAILGCTHYPLLRAVLDAVLPGTHLVDSASATAAAVKQVLGDAPGCGSVRYLVTDHIERFVSVGTRFLGAQPDPVTWVDLGEPTAPFALAAPAAP